MPNKSRLKQTTCDTHSGNNLKEPTTKISLLEYKTLKLQHKVTEKLQSIQRLLNKNIVYSLNVTHSIIEGRVLNQGITAKPNSITFERMNCYQKLQKTVIPLKKKIYYIRKVLQEIWLTTTMTMATLKYKLQRQQ